MTELNFKAWSSILLFLVLMLTYSSSLPFGKMWFSSFLMSDFLNFSLKFSVSNLSTMFLMCIYMISMSVFTWGGFYMKSVKLWVFYWILLGFVGSMLILVMSDSLFSLFLGWEGLGITSFILIIFFQNWLSIKGGLLTLLTNRLGDAILMISVSYWLTLSSFKLFTSSSSILLFLLTMVSFTKSAQWPFISWLPAAMAAPTPVSSLVHSSTLVTAGIWLMVWVGQMTFLNFKVWFYLGFVTLMVASSAALVESDAKKVVALSTLSQLGLMFLSLSLGNMSMCMFHVVTHAFAKSNLFLVIGNILHSRFSSQDSRSLGGMDIMFSKISVFISISSLVGLMYISGFYSKDQILMSQYILLSSLLSIMVLISIVSLTLAYCMKLFLSMFLFSDCSCMWTKDESGLKVYPMVILMSMTMGYGFFSALNFSKLSLPFPSSSSGMYWMLLLSSSIVLYLSIFYKISYYMFMGFLVQLMKLDILIWIFFKSKIYSITMESSILENFYALFSSKFSFLWSFPIKMIFLLSILSVMLIFF